MKKNVYIFGLGYVGYPLMLILANKRSHNKNLFNVTGIELSKKKIDNLYSFKQKGNLPFDTTDRKLIRLARTKVSRNIKIYKESEIDKIDGTILICVNFDGLQKLNQLKNFFKKISSKMKKSSLLIIESTLIPGTCEKILYPIIKKELKKRKIGMKNFSFGYSYERIMPGNDYVNSIINNFKSISGINEQSKKKISSFYKLFLNYKKFPITEFNKISECEAAKIMENSYRALNISFIDEWNKFSLINKLNLKKIINSIKIRKTHSNIMRPGIGVGGYCLTKDPMFAEISSKEIFKSKSYFPLSKMSVSINNQMPNFCFEYIKKKIKGLKKKKILIIGTAYKSNVSDTRYSPSISLIKIFKKKGYKITNIDPLVNLKKFLEIYPNKIKYFDLVIFSVPHKYLQKININMFKKQTIVFDLDYVLNEKQIHKFQKNKIKVYSLGDYSD